MLSAKPNGEWKVDGGAVHGVDFFFKDATMADVERMTDPARCRFVWCPEGVRVGVTVTLGCDGVIWPAEGREKAR